MPVTLNRKSYNQLIREDIKVVERDMKDSIEKWHVLSVLKAQIKKDPKKLKNRPKGRVPGMEDLT